MSWWCFVLYHSESIYGRQHFKFSLKAESADFDLKLSWMNLDTILWFDLCATHAMWNTTSFAQVSWFSAETADFRYQVWHKNPPAILDRVPMVVVLGPKSQFSWLSSGKTLSLTLHCLRHPTPSWHTFLDSSYQDLSYEIGPTTSRAFHYFDLIQYSSWLTIYWCRRAWHKCWVIQKSCEGFEQISSRT